MLKVGTTPRRKDRQGAVHATSLGCVRVRFDEGCSKESGVVNKQNANALKRRSYVLSSVVAHMLRGLVVLPFRVLINQGRLVTATPQSSWVTHLMTVVSDAG
jgi:hypothetical protein